MSCKYLINQNTAHHLHRTSPELFVMTYLKYFLIQYPCSKYNDAIDVNDGMVTSVQELGYLLFTVQNQGDVFLLHTDSYSVPPRRTVHKCVNQSLGLSRTSQLLYNNETFKNYLLQTSMPAIICEQMKIILGQTLKISFEIKAVLTDDAIHFSSLQNR